MPAYYNEIDPFASEWLKALISKGLIANGDVDTRSIVDVKPEDLRGYDQCHFFAGIGVWSYALRKAGWNDDLPFWTGSCPCQPFSAVGRGKGFKDSRHLWPYFYKLINECRPRYILGEQVSSPDGLAWFDLVSDNLESSNYAVGALDICAAGIGAPHIRQRLYWSAVLGVGDSDAKGLPGHPRYELGKQEREAEGGSSPKTGIPCRRKALGEEWRGCDWVGCKDGYWRPIESGTSPLAHGSASRVGRLRGYGNAIVAPLAEEFIRCFMEIIHER